MEKSTARCNLLITQRRAEMTGPFHNHQPLTQEKQSSGNCANFTEAASHHHEQRANKSKPGALGKPPQIDKQTCALRPSTEPQRAGPGRGPGGTQPQPLKTKPAGSAASPGSPQLPQPGRCPEAGAPPRRARSRSRRAPSSPAPLRHIGPEGPSAPLRPCHPQRLPGSAPSASRRRAPDRRCRRSAHQSRGPRYRSRLRQPAARDGGDSQAARMRGAQTLASRPTTQAQGKPTAPSPLREARVRVALPHPRLRGVGGWACECPLRSAIGALCGALGFQIASIN